jgi:DNA invertase Pin-like site-specific DNA recombinase
VSTETAGRPLRCCILARVSTTRQHEENQLEVLRTWMHDRGVQIAREYVIQDSAWENGNGAKGKEFDATRAAILNEARLGEWDILTVWAIDRTSRRGIEDTLATMRRIYECGRDIWSHQEPWLVTTEPRMRELLVSFMAWMAEQESARRSERIKAGIARRKREGKPMPGGKAGRKMPKGSGAAGGTAGWEGEAGEARREALRKRNRDRATARQQAEGTTTGTETGQ